MGEKGGGFSGTCIKDRWTKPKGDRIKGGKWGRLGGGEVVGRKWRQLYLNTNKKNKLNKRNARYSEKLKRNILERKLRRPK